MKKERIVGIYAQSKIK